MIVWIVGGFLIALMLIVQLHLNRQVKAALSYKFPIDVTHDDFPPISIIKPVYGADAHTQENFRSWSEQNYPAAMQLVFSFQSANDSALSIAESIAGPHEYTVIVTPVAEGYSGKMSNLLHGMEAAHYARLIFCDSDIRADPDLCRQLIGMQEHGVDLVSCLMRHVGGGNVWGRIFAAFWNFQHMGFIAPAILKHGRDATGGTLAVSRSALIQMGGLAAFKDYVAEDVAMGRKAHEIGLRVGLGPIVDSPVDAMSFPALLDKFARAALYGASMNSLGNSFQYAVLFSYWPVLLAAALIGSKLLVAVGAVMAFTRLGFASHFWNQTQGKHHLFWEIWLSDLVFLFSYARAQVTRKLVWGGQTYRVLSDGRMVKSG